MKKTSEGHLWVGVEHKGIEYVLTYNHGIDATTIFKEVVVTDGDDDGNLYIDYFHGGFDCQTELPYEDLLKDAETYIDMWLETNDASKVNVHKHPVNGLALQDVDYDDGSVWFTVMGLYGDVRVDQNNILFRDSTDNSTDYENEEALALMTADTKHNVVELQRLLGGNSEL